MSAVTIIDYGVGNLLSVARALTFCGGEVEVTSDLMRIARAERLVLPGVGAFGDCIDEIKARKLDDEVKAFAASGRPLLGICVGMQVLFDYSEEFGVNPGLGLIPGAVKAIPSTGADGAPHKIPHIGWSPLRLPEDNGRNGWQGTLLEPVSPGAAVYFVHSFTGWPDDPAFRLADAEYDGRRIAAAVGRDNVWGTQFHPEKSGPTGLGILKAFLAL